MSKKAKRSGKTRAQRAAREAQRRSRALAREGGDSVWHRSADEATLDAKPRYNGFAGGHGAHGDAKYNRTREQRAWKRQLRQEGALRGPFPVCEESESGANGAPGRHRDLPAIAARIAVAIVFLLNVQCALQFALWPAAFAGAYELSGVAGEAAVRGLGVAFLMWNVTYPAVIASPRRFRALYVVVLAQQAIGLAGESAILLSLPAGHDVLAASILRFIAFDAAGLALMAAAFVWLTASARRFSLKKLTL